MNHQTNTTKSAENLILIASALIILATVIGTLTVYRLNPNIDDASHISNILGTIISPIIGILGSILVFYALCEQVKANNLVQEQIDKQSIKEALQIESASINQLC